ncbi:hypothetical protein EMIHUDRAFT_250862 [Emiliania huxleyi CCMP1516]|uniref:Uncharacterized protein n=2 Tax=Emiliania huxleyi TaxID=2903 RepID=A0A0D3HXA8_EMIH1|nr:hypothetical protein EMIHUDRAFT_250862 [Emiliania huxleyi CCMP1516]EOD03643.1 hypothetical protein EMIHUDRAFT_250862 [Emiliania huxleyi CCMP1516]|eukprot:XP_005756072.1 hypothetical protein EMIHUDRAFT_250862 [Emiliania huxleyi CCMP1516]
MLMILARLVRSESFWAAVKDWTEYVDGNGRPYYYNSGMMLAELNASRAREQSERESQARFLGFMGVPK